MSTVLERSGHIRPDYTHVAKLVRPGSILFLEDAILKWYEIAPEEAPVPVGIRERAYDALCRRTPNAPNCGLPLYWPAPQQTLSTQAGAHRFSWDLRYNPVSEDGGAGGGGGGGGGSGGAVPHRTYTNVNAPWAPPGSYVVRLTANGKSYTQPLTLRLDPRVVLYGVVLALATGVSFGLAPAIAATRTNLAQALHADLMSAQ